MTTVNDILQFLESIAPSYMKMQWDNVGLLVGRKEKPVHCVLLALDPFESVCREASDMGADLIITHHPLIFEPARSVTDETDVGRCLMHLISHDIAAINAHTNYDCAPGGVNDILAETLELANISVIDPKGTDSQGNPWGLLRMGDVKEQTMDAFLSHTKKALGCEGLRYVCSGPVKKVAVGGGSCSSELKAARDAGCDTLVTADVSYNRFHDAVCYQMNLIDAGHFYTENPAIAPLARKLADAFPNLSVKIAKTHRDSMKFY